MMTLVLIWIFNIMCFFYRKDAIAVMNSRSEKGKFITALIWTIWIIFSVIYTICGIYMLTTF